MADLLPLDLPAEALVRRAPVIDCHVHLASDPEDEGTGWIHPRLRKGPVAWYLRKRLGMNREEMNSQTGSVMRRAMLSELNAAKLVDFAVGLALDSFHSDDGIENRSKTDLFVPNQTAARAARENERLLFGCSIHPYRKDALAELDRCLEWGAVLMKWLPVQQNIDPRDARCKAIYRRCADAKLPMLIHTGAENYMRCWRKDLADPKLLDCALDAGATVIAAHSGTRAAPLIQKDYVDVWLEMARTHSNFWGDSAALASPLRWLDMRRIIKADLCGRVIHGSDFPIGVPLWTLAGGWPAGELRRIAKATANAFDRDVLLKRSAGFPPEHFERAWTMLRIPDEKRRLGAAHSVAPDPR